VPYLGAPPPAVIRAGDTVTNLIGVLDYGRINSAPAPARDYRLHPIVAPLFSPVNPRPAAPAEVGGRLKVASFNVLNYFTTIDSGAAVCGPAGNLGCRGADSTAELTHQRDKIITAMLTIDADIFGLMELENNATASLQDLVNGLNAGAGPGTYDFIDTGTIGTDAIKVGLIYRTGTISATGSHQILDDTFDPDYDDSRNRPALAQTFVEQASGEKLTVIVNHFKSKGSSCGPGDDDTTHRQRRSRFPDHG
jgi:predicted extracellular nuclease